MIREYENSELSYISYRHAVLYKKEYGFTEEFEKYVIKSFDEFLDKKNASSNIWVATLGDEVVGSIGIVDNGDGCAQLRWFLVEPDCRGAGVGKKLIKHAMDFCKERCFREVFLWTVQSLKAARTLYRNVGFELSETKEHYIWGRNLVEECWKIELTNHQVKL